MSNAMKNKIRRRAEEHMPFGSDSCSDEFLVEIFGSKEVALSFQQWREQVLRFQREMWANDSR